MTKALWLGMLAATAAAASAGIAQQQAAPGPAPAMSPQIMEQMRRAEAANNALPDTPGTGAFPAIKEADASLPDHVVYRPADLTRLGGRKLGILAWGNGACGDDGANTRQHLSEIASHGYLVIANGTIKSGPGTTPTPPPAFKPGDPLPAPRTRPEQLTQAIDWAIRENGRRGSRYFGRIDAKAIAVSGWSCGGLQALKIASSDPRVKTAVIHNSGNFPQPMPMMGIDINRASLDGLRGPVLYILGGKDDIAFANGSADVAYITRVPVMLASLDVGHGGTFYQPNGGKVTPLDVAWLDWQLRGDRVAARWFVGADCVLCRKPEWSLTRKGI